MRDISSFLTILLGFLAFFLPPEVGHAQAPQAPLSQYGTPPSTITFYSHSFGENFPHAFVIIEDPQPDGVILYDAFGFTAKNLSPGILLGSVKGEIKAPTERYIRQSDPHFTLPISPQQRAEIMAVRQYWNQPPGSRYNLNKHNCVHFIAEIARAMGLQVNPNSEHFKQPKYFLMEITELNQPVIFPSGLPPLPPQSPGQTQGQIPAQTYP